MTTVGALLLGVGVGVGVYAYILYPIVLAALAAVRRRRPYPPDPEVWPSISITIPAHNEERDIADTLDRILQADYPADRRQVVVVSDASTDRTDEIVQSYAGRGVDLVRLPLRGGKTAAENAARPHLRGDIVVNTDASVRVDAGALKPLVRALLDPSVGVASGRDVSVGQERVNQGESRYVGYEMWVRDLETRVHSIVGASGCLYAIRRDLHMALVPEALSRDFAAALIARERSYRAVSVSEAICYVPRIASLRREYRRKVRTMTRGLETLWYKRALLNPVRYGLFAWMLWSHKLLRWLTPPGLLLALAGAVLLAPVVGGRATVLGGTVMLGTAALALVGWWWPEGRRGPRAAAHCAYVCAGLVAALVAWTKALRGELNPVWEPTRRQSLTSGS